MTNVAIPAWNADGVLPPINAAQPISPERSPYRVSLTDYVLRFGSTAERRTILSGMLAYRGALHGLGLVRGFQWLDGSFLEHVEVIEGRPPKDVDVVTFYRLPAGVSQRDLAARPGAAATLDHTTVKSSHHVDAYLADLGMDPERLTQQTAYWYSMWSHRRSQLWKGFVEVDLAPAEDTAATATLATLSIGGGAR